MATPSVIDAFRGEYRWLSNFWPCPVMFEGYIYPSVEHAYQAAKMHPSARAPFRDSDMKPGEAKRLGRRGRIRDEWDTIKRDVMAQCLREKFSAGFPCELSDKLLATGDTPLIEGNTWGDRYWGVCMGVGENWLGKLLMQRRDELRA